MAFFRHLRVLLWKNFVLRKRSKWATLAEILIPTILTLVIVVLRNITVNKDDPYDITTFELNSGVSFAGLLNMDGYQCNPKEKQHIAIGPSKYAKDFWNFVDSNYITKPIPANEVFYPYDDPNVVDGIISDSSYPNGLPHFIEFDDGPKNPTEGSTNSSSLCAAIFFDEPAPGMNFPHTYTLQANMTMFFNLGIRFPTRQKSMQPDEVDNSLSFFSKSRGTSLQLLIDNYIMYKQYEETHGTEMPGEDLFSIMLNVLSYSPAPRYSSPWQQFVSASASTIPMILFLSFTFSVGRICSMLTVEKETGVREALRMAGVSEFAFYLSWLIDFLIVFISSALLTTASCVLCDLLTNTSFTALLIIMLSFSLSTMSFSFFISSFFQTAKTAAIAGSVLYFMGNSLMTFIGQSGYQTRKFASLLPQLGFLQSMQIITRLSQSENTTADIANLFGEDRYKDATDFSALEAAQMMFISVPIYICLGMYFDQVVPTKLGSRRHPLFFLGFPWMKKKSVLSMSSSDTTIPPYNDQRNAIGGDMLSVNLIGGDNQHEKKNHEMNEYASNKCESNGDIQLPSALQRQQLHDRACVSVSNLTRTFKQDGQEIRAVDGLNLNLYSDEMTVLLGHNGAGKSTTISMLTGALPHSGGFISMPGGLTLPNDMTQIRASLGVCPQHDVLWANLSVEEHFRLFALLRVKKDATRLEEKNAIEIAKDLMVEVGLSDKRLAHAAHLSGGMKRKLSVALAFVGSPRVVVLDEPSSGMDPTARQQMWSMLKRLKSGRVCLLTTHYMDEAEALGDRVAVMAAGKLRCAGDTMFLRDRFKCGLRLVIVRAAPRILSARQLDGEEGVITAIRDGLTNAALKERDDEESKVAKEKLNILIEEHLGNTSELARKYAVDQKNNNTQNNTSKRSYHHQHASNNSNNNYEVLTDIANNMEIRIDPSISNRLPNFFHCLDRDGIEIGVSSYAVSVASLEEVFLKVAEGEEEEEEDFERVPRSSFISHMDNIAHVDNRSISASNLSSPGGNIHSASRIYRNSDELSSPLLVTGNASEHKKVHRQQNAVVEFKSANTDLKAQKQALMNGENDLYNNNNSNTNLISHMHRAEGINLLFLQQQALIQKRWRFFKRDKKSFICQLLLPLILILVGVGVKGNIFQPDYQTFTSQMSSAGVSNIVSVKDNPLNIPLYNLQTDENPMNSGAQLLMDSFENSYVNFQDPKYRTFNHKGTLSMPAPSSLPTLDVSTKNMFPFTAQLDSPYDKLPSKYRIPEMKLIRDVSIESAMWLWGDSSITTLPERKTNEYDTFIQYAIRPSLPEAVLKNIPDDQKDTLLSLLTAYGSTTVALVGQRPLHVAAFTVNTRTNAIAAQLQLNIPSPIDTKFRLLQITEGVMKTKNVAEGLSVAMFIQLAFVFVPLGIVAYAVREKQSGAKFQQFVSGCSPTAYWAANFIFDFGMYLIPVVITCLTLELFDVTMFVEGPSWPIFFALLVGFGLAAISQAGLLSLVFKEYSTGMIATLSLNLVLGFIAALIIILLESLAEMKDRPSLKEGAIIAAVFLRILSPSFSFGRGLMLIPKCEISMMGLSFSEDGETMERCKPSDWKQSGQEIFWLFTMGILYFVILISIEVIKDKQFSFREFFIKKGWMKPHCGNSNGNSDAIIEAQQEDSDVRLEKMRISSLTPEERIKQSLLVDNVQKVYPPPATGALFKNKNAKPHHAVRGVSIAVDSGEVFGLLGVNGAGKSTTMKLICAAESLIGPSGSSEDAGSITLDGVSVASHPRVCRRLLGYCPQHDAHLSVLTPQEHIELYIKLRGLLPDNSKNGSQSISRSKFVAALTEQKLQQTGLTAQRNNRAGNLSGGNRRRLSLAMATVGEPPVVLLDEPSCGLDPIARRALWSVVRGIAKNTAADRPSAVVLTTHAMEEADALCGRVGIMVAGQLKCLGSVAHLSHKYATSTAKLLVRLNTELPDLIPSVHSIPAIMNVWKSIGACASNPLVWHFMSLAHKQITKLIPDDSIDNNPEVLASELQTSVILALVQLIYAPPASVSSVTELTSADLSVGQERSGHLITHHVPLNGQDSLAVLFEKIETMHSMIRGLYEQVVVSGSAIGEKKQILDFILGIEGKLISEAVVQHTSLEDVFHQMATGNIQRNQSELPI